MVDDVEGDMDSLELDRYEEHLEAAVEEAARGRHSPIELGRPGIAYLERDEGYALFVRDVILSRFSGLVHVAELGLSGPPMGRDGALRLLHVGFPQDA